MWQSSFFVMHRESHVSIVSQHAHTMKENRHRSWSQQLTFWCGNFMKKKKLCGMFNKNYKIAKEEGEVGRGEVRGETKPHLAIQLNMPI